MDKDKYKKLLESIIIPEDASKEEWNLRYDYICHYLKPQFPKKLYRYRRCSELSFDAFDKDQLWFSSGNTMNDDFDARLSYNRNAIESWLNSYVCDNGIMIEKMLKGIKISENTMQVLTSMMPSISESLLAIKNMSREELLRRSNETIEFIHKDINKGLESVTEQIQARIRVACFAEDITSDMMWGIYAESATGFALEYAFKNSRVNDQKIGKSRFMDIFPIVYTDQRLDATEYAKYAYQIDSLYRVMRDKGILFPAQLINCFISCPDLFMPIKVASEKSSRWASECEWRGFYCNTMLQNEIGKSYVYMICKPSAIYLGRKMSDINRKIVTTIAKQKNIPIYQMMLPDDPRSFELEKERIF